MAKSYKIVVIPGDGRGPEVIAEVVKVLKAAVKAGSVASQDGIRLGLPAALFVDKAVLREYSRNAKGKSEK